MQNSSPHDFFDFKFFTLPHKVFQEENFLAECKKMKERFSLNAKDGFFSQFSKVSVLGHKDSYKVPMDGLPLFIDKTWEKIRAQKELNLPD